MNALLTVSYVMVVLVASLHLFLIFFVILNNDSTERHKIECFCS